MNFDDTVIETTIWNCIQGSQNPDDFKTYLEHRPANAAHVEDAELRIQKLNGASEHPPSKFSEAVSCIEKLAVAGDAVAQFHMGKFYDSGRGVVANAVAAVHWYEMAAASGEIRAAHNLAILKLAGQGTPKDVEGAVSLMERGIAAGESLSAEVLGRHFCQDEPLDFDRAVHFLRTAYELGSLSAGERLGRLLYSEATDSEQRADAKALLSTLVEKDYMPALKALAYLLSEGNGTDRDYEAARRLQLRLLQSGQKESMLSLGWLDQKLPPSTLNLPESEPLYWFKRAWEDGLVEAAGHIGRAYLYGEGVEQSIKSALAWFKLGAENGEAPCAYYIGSIYERSLIDETNDREAEPWFRQAAEAGIQSAQISLGRILVRNNGIPPNGAEAVKWLSLVLPAA